MNEADRTAIQATLERILVDPRPADLWQLHKALLVVDGEEAARARGVARAFHACLRELESKSASRRASRWGAVLGTAAVASVSAGEVADPREDALQKLVASGLPAILEVGAAVKSAQAWEVEAGLLYDEYAWFLSDELWDIASTTRATQTPAERRDEIGVVLDPLLDPEVPDGERAALVVDIFRAVLAARLVPLLLGDEPAPARSLSTP